jgi:hypothetical protein
MDTPVAGMQVIVGPDGRLYMVDLSGAQRQPQVAAPATLLQQHAPTAAAASQITALPQHTIMSPTAMATLPFLQQPAAPQPQQLLQPAPQAQAQPQAQVQPQAPAGTATNAAIQQAPPGTFTIPASLFPALANLTTFSPQNWFVNALAQSLMNGGGGAGGMPLGAADLQQQQAAAAAMLPYMNGAGSAALPQQGLNGSTISGSNGNGGNYNNGNSISHTSSSSYAATPVPPAMLVLPPGAGAGTSNNIAAYNHNPSGVGVGGANSTATHLVPSWNSNSVAYTTDAAGAGTAILPPVVHQESSSSSDALLAGLVPDRPAIPLSLSCDDHSLSSYQCLVRQQVELFQAKQQDIDANAQGRNRPIVLGQVGIRCRHCANLPPKARKSGAVYFPSKVRVYVVEKMTR